MINVYNLMEVVMEKTDASSLGTGGRDYFNALCHQSFPGPLVGGNPGTKELNKWIDDKIASYETAYMDVATRDLLRMLFSLLKIAVQYYGKLRSPFGSDQALKVCFYFFWNNYDLLGIKLMCVTDFLLVF